MSMSWEGCVFVDGLEVVRDGAEEEKREEGMEGEWEREDDKK